MARKLQQLPVPPGPPGDHAHGQATPPGPYDGNWSQTLVADDWYELVTEVAAQAKHEAERQSNQPTYGLPY